MKAIVCTKYGPPDVLQLKEVEKPVPKDNEVLIKVHATTVNRTDCCFLRAKPFFARLVTGLLKPKHSIPGTEFAGEIEAVGKNVSSFKVGNMVFGFNESDLGTQAEYMTIAEDKALATIPKNITYEQAAAITEGAFYAYNFINKVDIQSGHKALVNGATGGIGSATVQLLTHFEVNVTGVCKGKDFELVKSLGAEKVIDYTKEDFTKDDAKYDYVFDSVGKSSFAKCKSILKSGGVYMSSELGFMAQNVFFALFAPIMRNKKVRFPLPTDCKGIILFIIKLIEKGKFKAVIDRKYPIEQIVEAYKYVEKGQKTGNVVITVKNSNKT